MKTHCFLRVKLFALLIYITSSMAAQPQYTDFSVNEKQNVWSEKFDDNSKGWITDNNWLRGDITNGTYFLTCKNYNNATGLSYLKVETDTSRDFEIEARVQVAKGLGALIFGMSDSFDHYRIELVDNNMVVVVKNLISKNKVETLIEKKITTIKLNDFNKITLRKEKEKYYLFINEAYVTTLSGINFFGQNMGFSIGVDSKMMADEISFSYLKHSPPVFAWILPTQNMVINTGTCQFKGNIKSESPVNQVQITDKSNTLINITDSLKKNIEGVYSLSYTYTLQKGLNIVSFNITNSGGSTTSEPRSITYQPIQPPVITWQLPVGNNISIESDYFSIRACIKSVSKIQSVDIFVNEMVLSQENELMPESTEQCALIMGRNIPLVEGLNSIYIIAVNNEGKTKSETRYITYQVPQQTTEKRIALVIGNSNYNGGQKLKNPANDAQLMAATLKDLGFEVIFQMDADKMAMEKAIREFSRKLPDYKVALFYYAGHGMQIDGTNYLIPVDALLENKSDCKYEAVAMNFVVEEFEQYPDNINIVIIDACRNNPYRSWSRGAERGFRAVDPASGTIIAFATSEGSTASDGESANGLFTEELVKQMMVPQPIESVFKRTRVQVEKRSNNGQSPMEWNKLKGDFYFKK